MNLYGVLKKTTTFGKPIIFESNTPYRDAASYCKSKGMVLTALTYCEGYINDNTAVCVPYAGRYGKGYILCSQRFNKFTRKASTKYMDIEYWVIQNNGGK